MVNGYVVRNNITNLYHTPSCTQTHRHVQMYTHTRTNTHTHMYKYTHTCTNTHTHIHAHTHTQTDSQTHAYTHKTQMDGQTDRHIHTHKTYDVARLYKSSNMYIYINIQPSKHSHTLPERLSSDRAGAKLLGDWLVSLKFILLEETNSDFNLLISASLSWSSVEVLSLVDCILDCNS